MWVNAALIIYYNDIEFHLLSSIWAKPAGVKGLRVFPVLWVVLVGEVADGDQSPFGNGIPRQFEVIGRCLSGRTSRWWIETQNLKKHLIIG